MADDYIGVTPFEIHYPDADDEVKIRLFLASAGDPTKGETGVAFNAAGMVVAYAKPDESLFTAFPTFATENWDEIGYGCYDLIIRGSDATERALLDTVGDIWFYVKATATKEARIRRRVVPADTTRDDQWTDDRAALQDRLDAAITDVLRNATNRSRLRTFGRYADNPLTIETYGATGVTHSVPYRFEIGGYRLRMLYTPYPPSTEEEPCIVRSNDGITWVDTGIVNPLIAMGGAGTWNEGMADPDMIYVEDYDKWFMIVRSDQTIATLKHKSIFLAYSDDGLTWTLYDGDVVNGNTNPVILSGEDTGGEAYELDTNGNTMLTSPTLYYEDGVFYLYYGTLDSDGANRWKINLVTFTWDDAGGNVQALTRDSGNPIINLAQDNNFMSGCGHQQIMVLNDAYYMYVGRLMLQSGVLGAGWVYGQFGTCLLKSTSLDSGWTVEGPVLLPSRISGNWDYHSVYNARPLVEGNKELTQINGEVLLYYSGQADVNGVSRGIGLAYGLGPADDIEEIVDIKLTAEHGDRLWTTATGAGANVVVLTLNDDSGNSVNSIVCVVRDSTNSVIAARQTTNVAGQVTLQLDDGDYKVTYGPSASYTFSNPYDLTVSGNTAETFACVILVIPASADPGLCTCWIDIYYAVGALAGILVAANGGSVEVASISPHWSVDSVIPVLARGDDKPIFQTNAVGRASFDAVRGAELRLKVTRPGAVDTITITVPDQASYYIPLAGAER